LLMETNPKSAAQNPRPLSVLLAALLALTGPSVAQTQQRAQETPPVRYTLTADPRFSARAGAESLIALHRGSYALTDRFLPPRLFPEDTFWRKGAGVLYRLGKLWLLEGTFDYTTGVVQHEVFGHGARVRELDFRTEQYYIGVLPPYGSGGGFIRYDDQGDASTLESNAVTTGGVTSMQLLASGLRDRGFLRGRLHYRETGLYLGAFHNFTEYVLSTEEPIAVRGNDIASFLRRTQWLYDRAAARGAAGNRLTLDALKRQVLVNFLDPYQWYALYALAVRYAWQGRAALRVPALHVLGGRYLPSPRLELAPFGRAFALDNLFAHAGRLFGVYGRYGNGPLGRFWGAGARAKNLARRGAFTLGARLDVWRQPRLAFGEGASSPTPPHRLGAGARLRGSYRLSLAGLPLQLTATLGYKTRGWVPGQPLRRAPYAAVGLGLVE